MKTTALRLYGKNDARLETFELPPIKDDEILAKIVTDSLCMSSYKALVAGEDHKRVPNDVATNPIILGHEFCGELVQVGKKWSNDFAPGQRFAIQPALNYKGRIDAPGYSFPYIGGCATYINIPSMVMECDCLLPYNQEAFFYGSLAEPVSCVIGSMEEFFHYKPGIHAHTMGILEGGTLAIVAGAGPMGSAAVDYILHAPKKPRRMVVSDIDAVRLARISSLISPEDAAKEGVELIYVNTRDVNAAEAMINCNEGNKFDDVLVMAPVRVAAETGSAILGFNGCLSFFAGPTDPNFSACINFYDIHYNATHYLGTVGGNNEDMRVALRMMEAKKIDPAILLTHIGGLDCSADATANLPKIPGGKKLVYTQISMPLTAIDDFAEKGKTDMFFKDLDAIVKNNNGIWCAEAEKYLLKNATPLK